VAREFDLELFDKAAFEQALADTPGKPIPIFKQALNGANEFLKQRFAEGRSATELIYLRAQVVDEILQHAWSRFFDVTNNDIALVAVGGYGRGELHPLSDIDIQILIRKDATPFHDEIVGFTTFMWDIGLEVGHSVRTIKDCIREAKQDITVATNILESRLLTGPEDLFVEQKTRTSTKKIWPSKKFFQAKWEEQQARHQKFNDTAYNLEPNLKEGPGGLRDIQMIGWVAKRHFNATTLHDLVKHNFLTEEEYLKLKEGQAFLWRIRFAMHVITGRREDRLLIDHQRTLATQFGYQDDFKSMAVEKFMKDYYRTVMELSRLNEMLLNLFQEELLIRKSFRKPKNLNKRFQVHNHFIEVVNDNIFKHYPFALLEVFLLMEQHQNIKGVRANTIRLIRNHLNLIDDDFRSNLACQALFMEILRQPHGITHELRRMNRYGVLAAYLPVFENIVGLMQHNLFHVYTVDEHTLMAIRNIRRFTVPEFKNEFPLCSDVIQTIPKQELLILAGMFHDIAKGRGGSHAEKGAADAYTFCQQHQLSKYDSKLVQWLVQNHLVMSDTAQKKDISDPDTIFEFASLVGEIDRLKYIYLLTVADIRATGPNVWNSWKNTLLRDLYHATKRVLRRGLDDPILSSEHIESTQSEALKELKKNNLDEHKIRSQWQHFDDEYFLRYSANEIVWHTTALLDKNQTSSMPIQLIRNREKRGGTEIFVYAKEHENIFAQVTSALEQAGLTIVDARVLLSKDQHVLASFVVLDENNQPVNDGSRISELKKRIRQRVKNPDSELPPPQQHLSRQAKSFKLRTDLQFWTDKKSGRTAIQISTMDRPGLLSRIARAFLHCDAHLHNAKIATYGERAEDIFYITSRKGKALETTGQLDCIKQAVNQYIDDTD